MKLENQVTSLELSKKLKELGVKQEGLFRYCGGHTMYHDNDEGQFEVCENTDLLSDDDDYCDTAELVCEFTISAFTVAELGDLFPDGMKMAVKTTKGLGGWHCELYSYEDMPYRRLHLITEPKEVDARAKMLIYLLEPKEFIVLEESANETPDWWKQK
jgi:hypothetical protein